jgi:hypothetical protein
VKNPAAKPALSGDFHCGTADLGPRRTVDVIEVEGGVRDFRMGMSKNPMPSMGRQKTPTSSPLWCPVGLPAPKP